MRYITENLLTGWNFIRWIRLGLGLFISVQAIQLHDTIAGLVAAWFLFQAVTNTGCCGASGCSSPVVKTSENDSDTVEYNEVTDGRE